MVSHFVPVISRKELLKEKAELFQNMVSVAVLIQRGFLFKKETKDTASIRRKYSFLTTLTVKLCSEIKYIKYINIPDKNIFEIKLFDIQLVGSDCYS